MSKSATLAALLQVSGIVGWYDLRPAGRLRRSLAARMQLISLSLEGPIVVNSISLTSTVRAARDQVSCDLAGQTVILGVAAGLYYGLDEVGTSIWNLLQEPRTVRDIRDELLRTYDVDVERCERDLIHVLGEMMEHRLIETDSGSS